MIQSSCCEEVRRGLRERDHDPVGQLEARVLAFRIQLVDQVETRFSTSSSGSSAVSSATVIPSRVRDRPALLADPLDEHLVRGEVVAGRAEAPVRLLELARLERRAHRAELLAELRPEHGQVRLHAELGRLDVAELDLLHAQLLADLVHMPLRERRALDDEPAQRLAQRKLRARARLAAEIDDTPRLPPPRPAAARPARPPPASSRERSTRAARPAAARARGARRGTASPARSRRATAASAVRSVSRRPRRRPRSAGASGGCTSSRDRRRTPRTTATTSGVQNRSYASVASATSCSTRDEQPAVERLQLAGARRGRTATFA